jgi:hypothetical protein
MTREILLIQQYSALVAKVEAENQALRDALSKKHNDYILMYNSRERYKALYNRLCDSVDGLATSYEKITSICK